jgi:hypothetical protein
MKKFIIDVIAGVVADPRVAAMIDHQRAQIEAFVKRMILENVLPVIPIAIGAAVDRAADRLTDLDQDGKVDAGEVVDAARDSIDKLLPPGINLPVIGNLNDLVKGLFPDLSG